MKPWKPRQGFFVGLFIDMNHIPIRLILIEKSASIPANTIIHPNGDAYEIKDRKMAVKMPFDKLYILNLADFEHPYANLIRTAQN